ncbi:MAG TPA: hypothetical protein VK430_01150 [Xanthobacteraceae bacterium]|nr:hypothetical protein [Xanthobacteraceae bacterium]
MNAINLDFTNRSHGVARWVAVIGGTAVVIITGAAALLGAASFFSANTFDHRTASVPAAASDPLAAPSVFKIVPSPVIETNSQFFFGTGDSSAGYYAERPIQ